MSSLLGGHSSQSSTSQTGISNQAYPGLVDSLGSTVNGTGGANGLIQSLLGGGQQGQEGLNNFKNNSGYQFQLDQGTKAITNNAATNGMLHSGSTLKALTQYGQGLAGQTFNQYLSNLLNVGNQGISAANVISGAGGTTNTYGTSNGSSKTGLGL